jgi:hypothetical protein
MFLCVLVLKKSTQFILSSFNYVWHNIVCTPNNVRTQQSFWRQGQQFGAVHKLFTKEEMTEFHFGTIFCNAKLQMPHGSYNFEKL